MKDIDFIAKRYRKGRFEASSGWRRLGVAPVSFWRRYRVAAAVAATVIISATAALIYQTERKTEAPQPAIEAPAPSPLTQVKVIDFENASLTDVVKKIESVYDVKVGNLPSDGKDYKLSLHYEGTPTDLIATINEILGTDMTVAEK